MILFFGIPSLSLVALDLKIMLHVAHNNTIKTPPHFGPPFTPIRFLCCWVETKEEGILGVLKLVCITFLVLLNVKKSRSVQCLLCFFVMTILYCITGLHHLTILLADADISFGTEGHKIMNECTIGHKSTPPCHHSST